MCAPPSQGVHFTWASQSVAVGVLPEDRGTHHTGDPSSWYCVRDNEASGFCLDEEPGPHEALLLAAVENASEIE